MKRVVVAAQCKGKEGLSRPNATKLALKQQAKGVRVMPYKCEV